MSVTSAPKSPKPLTPELVQKRAKNWAFDEQFCQRATTEILPLVNDIRNRRQGLNEFWSQLHRVWALIHDAQGYTGRSNLYMPAGKKVINTLVSQLVAGTFSGDDNFGVEARHADYRDKCAALRDCLKYRIDSVARVRPVAGKFYRQLAITGNSPLKVYYDRRQYKVIGRAGKDLAFAPMVDVPQTTYDGPVVRSVDARNLYVYPEDADSLEDAQIVFEDTTATMADLLIQAEKGTYNRAAVLKAQGNRNGSRERASNETLSAQDISSTSSLGARNGWAPMDVTEVWLWLDPEASRKEDEKNPVPFLISFSGDQVIRAQCNPLWHQKIPYLYGRMDVLTGSFYGNGQMAAIRMLNLMLNDQTNQGMDAATFALNPIMLINPNMMYAQPKPLAPGVVYQVADMTNALKTITPDMTPLNAMSVLSTMVMSWINDFGGAPPVLQGGASPGRAFKTATGIGTANANAQVPLAEIIKDQEAEVWEPMLEHFWWLDQQFAKDEVIYWANGSVNRINPREYGLDAGWMFKWLASSRAAMQATKGSQLVQLLGIMKDNALLQQIQKHGRDFNPVPLITSLVRDGFGLTNVDEIFPPMMGAPAVGPATGSAPEANAPGAMPGNLPPGLEENEDFLAMRAEADAMAAQAGSESAGLIPGLDAA